ncbi:nucleoside recognition domain-containing protein [Thermoanaerobacterium thermosaccharolyticum]
MKKNKSRNFLVISVLFIVVSIIVFPKNSLSAAKAGINLWLFTVFPALLPFFIGSELLLQLGFVRTIGKFLEPIMRPLFNVSGNGAFAMAVGYTSGYPVGAQVIKRLW